jgi:hypothetical protein
MGENEKYKTGKFFRIVRFDDIRIMLYKVNGCKWMLDVSNPEQQYFRYMFLKMTHETEKLQTPKHNRR